MQEIEEQSPRAGPIEDNGADDFSFVCLNPDGSPISADDAFVNGQIRPFFPILDQRILATDAFTANETTSVRPPLKKLFTEELICSTDDRSRVPPEMVKKSYSTGFSKLWRFGDKIRRSSSEGKEAFVFLRSDSSGSGKGGGGGGGGEKAEKKGKKGEKQTTSYYNNSHERLYARNKAENEMNKRKSYLPYRSNLMGFFTAPNGFNRNF